MFVTNDRRAKCILQNVSVLCMYVCIYVCMYVFMYVCIYVCMYLCMYVFMYVCMYLCMYVCISLTVGKEVAYSSLAYTHFQKPLVSILQIYLGFYRRCFWFESLLSCWLSILEMFNVMQCSGVKT